MTARTLVRGARVVTMDDQLGDLDTGDLMVEGNRIGAVGRSLDPGDAEVVDGSDWIALPGFIDTHRHTWQSAIRHTYADLDPLQYFAQVLDGIGASYTPEDVGAGTFLGAVAALSAGTTTLLDWAHIQNSPDHTEAGIEALHESGIRAVFGHGWPLVRDGSWTGQSRRVHPDDIRRVRDMHFASEEQLLTLCMAARGPEMAAREVWIEDLRLARELGIRTSVHVGAYVRNAGVRAVDQYRRSGLLGDDMTFVHCGHCGSDELGMIANAGAAVSLGVHCELNSQGIGDIPLDTLLSLGVKPSLSGDTETKCSGDMFTQMRMLFGYYRSWVGGGHSSIDHPPALTLRDVLGFATIQGARALGLESRIGSLTPGKQADVVFVRATDLNLAPVSDPVAAVVLAAHEGNVDSVLVAGRFVKRSGLMCHVNVAHVVERARQSRARLIGSTKARASA